MAPLPSQATPIQAVQLPHSILTVIKTGSLFDASGKLVEVTEYNEGQTYKTRYEYDGAGNLITVIDKPTIPRPLNMTPSAESSP